MNQEDALLDATVLGNHQPNDVGVLHWTCIMVGYGAPDARRFWGTP